MTVYAISEYNHSNNTFELGGLYETKELAIEQLRVWADEIKSGKWYLAKFVEWHDEDHEEVTWMEFTRSTHDGAETRWCYCVEEVSIASEIRRSFC